MRISLNISTKIFDMRHSFHALAVSVATELLNCQIRKEHSQCDIFQVRHCDSCKLEGMTDKPVRLVCYAHSILCVHCAHAVNLGNFSTKSSKIAVCENLDP